MKQLSIILFTVGALVCALGVILALQPHFTIQTVAASAHYISSDTCFTCHNPEVHDWDSFAQPIAIQDFSLKTTALVTDAPADSALPVEAGLGIQPYAAESHLPADQNHHYFVQTGAGYRLLPERWRWTAEGAGRMWLEQFNSFAPSERGLIPNIVCEQCHRPARQL